MLGQDNLWNKTGNFIVVHSIFKKLATTFYLSTLYKNELKMVHRLQKVKLKTFVRSIQEQKIDRLVVVAHDCNPARGNLRQEELEVTQRELKNETLSHPLPTNT